MRKTTPISLAIATLFVTVQPAQGQALERLKGFYNNVAESAQKGASATPVESRRNDSWGDAAPTIRQAPKRNGDVDERFRDERNGRRVTEAGQKVESPKPERAPVRAAAAKPPAKPTRNVEMDDDYFAVESRMASEDQAQRRRAETAPADASAKCVNVARVWEGASAMARGGDTGRAYAAYLTLLSSCSKADELKGTLFQARTNLPPEAFSELLKEPVIESPRLALAKYYAMAQESYALDKAGKKAEALEVVQGIAPSIRDQRDVPMMRLAGWLEFEAKNTRQALDWFRAAIKLDRNDQSSREGMVRALLVLGDLDTAQRELAKMDAVDTEGLSADLSTARAFQALKEEDFQEALAHATKAKRLGSKEEADLDQIAAWSYLGLKQYDKASVLFQKLVSQNPSDTKLSEGLMAAWKASGERDKIAEAAKHPNTPLGKAAQPLQAAALRDSGRYAEAEQIDGVRQEGRGSRIGAYTQVMAQSGKAGEARLTATTGPVVEGTLRMSSDLSMKVTANAESFNNGVKTATGNSAAIELKLEGEEEVTLKAQTSQLENGVNRIGGGLKLRQYSDSGFVEVEGSVTPLRDSLRSYVGDYNASGVLVGQATKYEGRIGGTAWLSGTDKLEYNLSAGAVQSKNAAANTFMGGKVAVLREFQKTGYSWFAAGPEVAVSRFSRDENRYDAGNWGGYYSPTFDLTGGLRLKGQTLEGKRWMAKFDTLVGLTRRTMYDSTAAGSVAEVNASAGFLTSVGVLKTGLQLNMAPGYTSSGIWFGLDIPFEKRTGIVSSDLGFGH